MDREATEQAYLTACIFGIKFSRFRSLFFQKQILWSWLNYVTSLTLISVSCIMWIQISPNSQVVH